MLALLFLIEPGQCHIIDSTSVKINSRYSFYSYEKTFEIIFHLPVSVYRSSISIHLKINDKEVTSWKGIPGTNILRVPFKAELSPAVYNISAAITTSQGTKYKASAPLIILSSKPNEVKSDRLTGGLIAGKREFFPFGFYCYSPVYPTLPEEEVVKGFNVISPYQKIVPETLRERKAYMDRCAELGMKVHYNLISVSGGTGNSSSIKDISEEERMSRLMSEIKAFMDHPALLAWYIADEPNGFRIPPENLRKVYDAIKSADPWHPVSMVFMAPFLSSRNYADALDIVIADPYPVPNRSITLAGEVTKQLTTEFKGKKSVWIVPQAFGGGEWWSREPSVQEIRSMTYQAIVNGAKGIQFFIRHGLNSFPKSTVMWNECGRMAQEIAEITPWLLSDEEPSKKVTSGSQNIDVKSSVHDGRLLVVAVNKSNLPEKVFFTVQGLSGRSVKVIFENRKLNIEGSSFSDYLPAFGSQIYLIDLQAKKESVVPFRGNLLKDPGFEDLSSFGVPASCYAWNEGDRGATYFLDSREHVEGMHSLRLVTPADNKSSRLRFFPIKVSKGKKYMISIWAKADPDSWINEKHFINKPHFEIGFGEYGSEVFFPSDKWEQFVTSVTIPYDTIPSARINAILRMPGKGTAWFDMFQVFEAVDIGRSVNPEILSSGFMTLSH